MITCSTGEVVEGYKEYLKTNHWINLLNNIKQAFQDDKLDIILASKWFRDLEARKRKSCGVRS